MNYIKCKSRAAHTISLLAAFLRDFANIKTRQLNLFLCNLCFPKNKAMFYVTAKERSHTRTRNRHLIWHILQTKFSGICINIIDTSYKTGLVSSAASKWIYFRALRWIWYNLSLQRQIRCALLVDKLVLLLWYICSRKYRYRRGTVR